MKKGLDILYADPNQRFSDVIRPGLVGLGNTVFLAESYQDAENSLINHNFNLLLTVYEFPDMYYGTGLITFAKSRNKEMKTILTHMFDLSYELKRNPHIDAFIMRDLMFEQLARCIHRELFPG